MSDAIRFEAWTLPESGTFERQAVLGPVSDFQVQVRNGKLGSGSLSLPDDFAEKDKILLVDPDDHSNDVGSLIRAFRGESVLAEWYALRMSDTFSDGDPLIEVTGDAIERALDKMIVLPYDYPTDPIADPNWIYGAESFLRDSSFEDGSAANELQLVWNDATGGTFKLSYDGSNWTGDLAYDATGQTVATALAGLPGITDVRGSGTHLASNPWVFESVDPTDPGATLQANDTNLTGETLGTTISLLAEGGSLDPGRWTRSVNPVTGRQHGTYTTFEVSTDQARTGTHSLKIDGDAPVTYAQYPGGQQIVKVTPGRRYRAAVWLWSTSGTDPFRLVIRDTNENLIAWSGSESTLTPSTWTELTTPGFVVPDGVTEIVFRFAYVGGANPAVFYADDALCAPGFVAAPLGEIFNNLLDDLAAHVSVGAWLTRSWSDTLDSNGNAWDHSLAWAIKRGMSLLQLLDYAKRWGYEYRIRWTGSAHALDLFNPGGMGTDHSADDTPAIVGRVTGSGPLVRRVPEFTWMLAEGDGGAFGVAEDTDLSGAFAKWMDYWPNRTGRTSAGLASAAAQRIAEAATQTEGFMVRVQDPTAGNLPLEDIVIGDTVQTSLPGKTTKRAYRAVALTITGTETVPIYEWHMSSHVFTPEAAMAEAVNRLIREYKGLDDLGETDGGALASVRGNAGGFTLRIAASNATEVTKAAADFVCLGVNDGLVFSAAWALLPSTGGRLLMSEGDFYVSLAAGSGIDLNGKKGTLEGSGLSTRIFNTDVGAADTPIVDLGSGWSARNFYVEKDAVGATVVGVQITGYAQVENVTAAWCDVGFDAGGTVSLSAIVACIAQNCVAGFDCSGFESSVLIGCRADSCSSVTAPAFLCAGHDSLYLGNIAKDGWGDGFQIGETGQENQSLQALGNSVVGGEGWAYVIEAEGFSLGPNYAAGEAGQVYVDADRVTVSGATFDAIQLDADNATDGVEIAATATDATVMNNRFIPAPSFAVARKFRYAVNIGATTGAVVVGNDMRDATGTAPILDGGTDTKFTWPNHATYGDNYVTATAAVQLSGSGANASSGRGDLSGIHVRVAGSGGNASAGRGQLTVTP